MLRKVIFSLLILGFTLFLWLAIGALQHPSHIKLSNRITSTATNIYNALNEHALFSKNALANIDYFSVENYCEKLVSYFANKTQTRP